MYGVGWKKEVSTGKADRQPTVGVEAPLVWRYKEAQHYITVTAVKASTGLLWYEQLALMPHSFAIWSQLARGPDPVRSILSQSICLGACLDWLPRSVPY